MLRRGSRLPLLSVAARAVFAGAKRVRLATRPLVRGIRIARHLTRYRVPDEQSSCPACRARAIRHLEPLSPGHARTHFGFISGCRQCGVIFANPLPPPAVLASVYSPDGDWGRHRQEEQEKQVTRGRIAQLFAPIAADIDVLHPQAGAAVLDFGCGLGGMLDAFAALGWQTFGIDPATRAAFARHGELTSVPTEPRFDLAILHHVLEHVTEPLTILEQIAGAVRPGGYLLISVPNLDDLAEHGELKYCIRPDVHVLAYSGACLTWLAAAAGFRVLSISRGSVRSRQRVVLARRESGTRPARPLRAATDALDRFFGSHPGSAAPLRGLPVRFRAAYADMVRSEWRLQREG